MTEISIEERRAQIQEVRDSLRNLVKEQVEDKSVLRHPHEGPVGMIMSDVFYRARSITSLHVKLNRLCGKENSHKYKQA